MLRQIYRKHGIKKKAVRWFKQARDFNQAQYNRELGKMKAALKRARDEGYRVIYIDETMITRKTVC